LEKPLLERANRILELWKQPPMTALARLYSEVDQVSLTTFAEFDCYRSVRGPDINYLGPVNAGAGAAPVWPVGRGKRVFAYLKPFPAMKPLLSELKQRGLGSLIFMDRVGPAIRSEFECETMRFETRRLDLAAVARECDLAIINGAHATSIAMLLAGKPSLQIPHFLEHTLNARAVERTGGGLVAPSDDAERVVAQLSLLLERDEYAQAARCFADRYRTFDATTQGDVMLRCIDGLLDGRTPSPVHA
jgi:hypothetical protein